MRREIPMWVGVVAVVLTIVLVVGVYVVLGRRSAPPPTSPPPGFKPQPMGPYPRGKGMPRGGQPSTGQPLPPSQTPSGGQ